LRTGSRPEPRFARIGGIAAVVLVALLGALVAAPNARADGDVGAAVPAAPGAAEQPQGTVEPAPDPAAADQAAATAQEAAASAVAAQPEQPNVVVIVRINSPGDDIVTQTNTITVDSAAWNESKTTQTEAPAAAALLLSHPLEHPSAAATTAARAAPKPARTEPAEPATAPRQPAAVAAPRLTPPRQPRQAVERKAAAVPAARTRHVRSDHAPPRVANVRAHAPNANTSTATRLPTAFATPTSRSRCRRP
jgi:hypothetical protein